MAIFRASEFFRTHNENVLLNEIKTYSLTNKNNLLVESIDRFREQAEIAIEVGCYNKPVRQNPILLLLVKQTFTAC